VATRQADELTKQALTPLMLDTSIHKHGCTRTELRNLMTAEINLACGVCGHSFTQLDSDGEMIEHNEVTHRD